MTSGGFKPFKQFPTPNRLAQAQREYAAQGFKPEIDEDTGIPVPFPPPTTKNQIFNKKDYKHIDHRASQVPRKVGTSPMKDLVQFLIKGTKNDIEKVRSFFVWIASQNDDKYEIIFNTELDNPFNKAMMARTKCYDYNKLFLHMCEIAEIPCHLVDGAAKGFQNEEATEIPLDTHTWCIVFVEGAWRFVDQNFGCSSVHQGTTNWQVVDGDLDDVKKQNKASEKVFCIGEEHFLTDPELFIYKHFPSEDNMQLLARPVKYDEFNKMAIIKRAYFDWEFEDLSEPKTNILVENGMAEIWFKPNRDKDLLMHYALLKPSVAEMSKETDKQSYVKTVRLENRDGKKVFRIYFNHVGLYKFQVLVPEKDGKGSKVSWHCLVQYSIRCNCPYFLDIGNPVLPQSLQELGPGSAWKNMGIECDVTGGIIHANRGNATLQLRCSTDICFNFHLKKHDNEDELEDCVLIETNHDKIIVHIKTPSHGTFLLKAFTGKTEDPSLRHACNFLVESDMGCVTDLFPQALQKSIGAASGSTLLKPDKGGAYLRLGDREEELILNLKVSSSSEVYFMIKLLYYTGFHEVNVPEYVWFERSSDLLKIYCRFKFAGQYILRIFTKDDPQSNSYNPSWKYLLETNQPTKDCQEYTEKLKDWQQNLTLLSPKLRFLKHSTDYTFELQAPGVDSVSVVKIGEGETFELFKEGGETYSNTLNSLFQEGQIVLYSECDDEEDVRQLLRYQVLNEKNYAAKMAEQEVNWAEAITKKEKCEQDRKTKFKELRERQDRAASREKEERKDFEHNKEKLLKQEEILEEQAKELQFQARLQMLKITIPSLKDMCEKFTDDDSVHTTLSAALLLLAYSEEKTENPAKCKKIIKAKGVKSLFDEMMTIKLSKIHPAVVIRAKQLLRKVDWLDIKKHNPGAGLVYDWAKECTESHMGDRSLPAADIVHQKEIFNEN